MSTTKSKLVFLLSIVSVLVQGQRDEYNPHRHESPLVKNQRWFEGWYTRFTLNSNDSTSTSMGVIFGKFAPSPMIPKSQDALLSLLIQTESDGLRVINVHPEEYVLETPSACSMKIVTEAGPCFDLRISSSSSQSHAQITVRPSHQTYTIRVRDQNSGQVYDFTARIGGQTSRVKWSDKGPEEFAYGLPLPLHWYVHSTASPAHVEFKHVGSGHVLVQGEAKAHMEKNWGRAFPARWLWAQYVSSTSGLNAEQQKGDQIVLAGGDLGFGPVLGAVIPDTFLLLLRIPSLDMDLKWTPLMSLYNPIRVTTDNSPDSEVGEVNLKAQQGEWKIEIRIWAPMSTFGVVMCPTKDGFKDDSIESFKALFEVKLSSRDQAHVYHERKFEGGALEFGGKFWNQNPKTKHDPFRVQID